MFDLSYASTYSDSSLPRTPSPINPATVPVPMKGALDVQDPVNYPDHALNHGLFNVVDNPHAMLPIDDNAVPSESYRPSWQTPPRGSLLQDLYEGDNSAQARSNMHYMQQPPIHTNAWSHMPHASMQEQQHHLMRRATFPYVRHDQSQSMYMQQPHMMHQPHGDMYMDNGVSPDVDVYAHSQIKLEDDQRPMPRHQMMNGYPYPHPHPPYPYAEMAPMYHMHVQHTDDAASKETQYLRRRCFNCHTTEPPSWRRSTLNPGKIVCNKCGLYERTHLRPRPLRFDELRAGSKTRKGGRNAGKSPKTAKAVVKKESRDDVAAAGALTRRSSQSSLGASSDLDDSLSLHSSSTPPSSGSAPGSAYNSPHLPSYPLSSTTSSRDSHSPPAIIEGGIRLPNASLSDLGGGLMMSPPTNRASDLSSPPHSSPLLSAPSQDTRYRSSSLSQHMGAPTGYGHDDLRA
ncbi:hypothetical protein BD626DRAFT_424224 [Schizophyllum amplum]|uniref:GATA-type domain-containing protein n=1 Tax=Schizophyllum amplum TaxID=97359 RepID=A0A550CSQ5_9AGAR|nr:hypothetical protein BD626DRAFT_424224 [Auriculariopsis ampla]